MQKVLPIITLILLLTQNILSQSYLNIVIPGSPENVEGLFSPLLEKDDTLNIFVSNIYRSQFGGTGYIATLDKFGKLLNRELIDSLDAVFVEDLLLLNDSSFIISGQIFIHKDTISKYWISKVSQYGNIIWRTILDPKYNGCSLRKINKLGTDKYVVSGYTNRKIKGSRASDVSQPVHIILDSLGNLLIDVEFNNENPGNLEDFYGAIVDNLGNIYGGGTVNYKAHINYDYLLAKTNSNGEILWKKVYKNSNFADGLQYVSSLTNNSFIGIGFSGRKDFSIEKFAYILVINFNQDGDILWEKRIFYNYIIDIPRCVRDGYGNFICAGTIAKTQTDLLNGLILKFTPTGDSLWLREINYTDRLGEQFFNISQASDGGYYLTGFSWVEGDNSSKPWIVKVDSFGCLVPGCEKPVAIEDIKSGKEKAFVFFPNPASHVFYFLSRLQDHKDYHMEIYNLQGQKMQDYPFKPYNGTQYQVDIKDDLTSGHYIIQVTDDKGKVLQREKLEVVR